MIALLTLHLLGAIAAPTLVQRLGRNAFYVLALIPAATVVTALSLTASAFGTPHVTSVPWVPGLSLALTFRVDVLSWLMMLILGGVGALIMVYAARYFGPKSRHLGRFSGVFVAFAGAMLGVVTADHTMTLYLFWEATSVLSFLLIGHHHDRRAARAAAQQALIVTGSGALAMFSGLVILGQVPGGSYRISELIAKLQDGSIDPTSPLVAVAAVLILAGAFTKSAQVPAHFWLPGAMAAPTPVSAYLHAATMVKAGVYLVARLTPGLAVVPIWSILAVTLGLATMLVGGYRALRQFDLKLVLAYGTVSQLGLMMAAVGVGDAAALAAGLMLLIAHSLFKSTLFLTVGAIESATGTRDLRNLCGLRHHLPWLAGVAGLATVSMAGLPVAAGYLGKEALVTALWHGLDLPWAESSRALSAVMLVVLVLGSMLTVAYSWRFWWGAFADKRVSMSCQVKRVPSSMLAPITVLSAGALLGLLPAAMQRVVIPPTSGLPGHPHLAIWSGAAPALITLVIVGGGLLLIRFRPLVAKIQRRLQPRSSVVNSYTRSLYDLELTASRTTATLFRGSLSSNLAIIYLVVLLLGGYALWRIGPPQTTLVLWDNTQQLVLALAVMVAAVLTVRARRRMKAALGLAAVGLLVTLVFAAQGAPDLALTQLVVEAVSLVVFVLVFRKLPPYFSNRPRTKTRWLRLAVAAGVGAVVTLGGWLAAAARVHEPVSELMPAEALRFGGGENIVNVILVDIRAWDTVGEISVLLVTATGVASLIYLQSRLGRVDRAPRNLRTSTALLSGAAALRPRARSLVLEVSTKLLFPTLLILSVWLLLIGHNNPGGGFAGGAVAGLAFVLRYLAGGRYELGEAMPIPAGRLMGLGLFVAAVGGAMPLLFGNAVLQSTPVDLDLGLLGNLHFTTAMVLDIGVYVLVVGLIIDLVSALGAEIDRQSERDQSSRGRKRARKPAAKKSTAPKGGK